MAPASRVAVALPVGSPRARVSVIAIGKAAPAMTVGALQRWSDRIVDVLVVTTDGTDTRAIASDPRVEILRAGHPIPDRRSVRAAERCLARARALDQEEVGRRLLVLVSGGASALVCAPSVGVRLRDKQAVTRAMLSSGASIQEINVVRKHLSRIKGGGLARAAREQRVITLVLSDVIGGAIEDVGSGPAVSDLSTRSHARQLLRRYAARFGDLPLVATGAAENVQRARIVAAPEDLAEVMANELRARGIGTRVLPPSQAPASELAREYVMLARQLRPGTAVVRVAEPAVVVSPSAGRGGRSTHLATLVGRELPPRATFLAAATDGVDGTSGTAGAIVDRQRMDRMGEANIRRALERYDTGRLHINAGTALPSRPSGHNLADVHVLTMG